MLACRLLGHRFRFAAHGCDMRWTCERCGVSHAKQYSSPHEATRFAQAFDREDRADLGRRAPLLGMFPLRIARRLRRRR